MPNFFPPSPAFPDGLDSDYTLYLVYNTSETKLASDNEPWSDEIEIVPVKADMEEIWPENGFVTLEGELIYYDAVDKNENGKIYRFRRCARNLAGSASQFNQKGTWIRGFVVAEHHNQIADTIIKIEDFVGIDFDERTETLDYRIRNLRETPIIFDDWSCPDVNLAFVILENDPAKGILARYNVEINGTFNEYRLDFGDGTFTTSDQSGTHRYAYNASINPIVTITNDKCSIIQSPITREDPEQPTEIVPAAPFTITIPEIQSIPPFSISPAPQVVGDLNMQPLILPCPPDLTTIPNIGPISIGDINVPSLVSITPVNIPSTILISPEINIPSEISFPSFIEIGPAPSIPPISFAPTPSIAPIDINIDINIDAGDVPSCISLGCDGTSITVDWGTPPTLNVALVSGLNAQSVRRKPDFDPELAKDLGADYLALFENENDTLQVEYEGVGIPSQIELIAPVFSDIKIQHDIPSEIIVKSDIRIDASGIPSIIRLEHDLPSEIFVHTIDPIPSTIRLEHDLPTEIKLVGAPETIALKGPEFIPLRLEEGMEIPLVWKEGPINVKVELDATKLTVGEDGDRPCFMFVPCNPK